MKPDHDQPADKTPQPLSSEQAQQGRPSTDPVLQQPDPETEAVDKVITPTSIKEKEREASEIEQRLAEAEKKGRR